MADALGMNVQDIRNPTSQGGAQQQKVQAERRAALAQQQAQEQATRAARFSSKLSALAAQAQPGESAYLAGKGLTGFSYPILPDGVLVLTLVNESGTAAAAQTIAANGEKRLLTGSAKKGAYHVINPSLSPQTVIIGEGLATVLSVHLMRPDALAVVAIDAGNLLPVAQVMRQQYPQAQIVIAADNDWHAPGELDDKGKPMVNTGRVSAERAAEIVSGLVALPRGEEKADWDDLRQRDGLQSASATFNESLYRPQGEKVTAPAEVIEIGSHASQKRNTQKPYVDSRRNGLFWVEPRKRAGRSPRWKACFVPPSRWWALVLMTTERAIWCCAGGRWERRKKRRRRSLWPTLVKGRGGERLKVAACMSPQKAACARRWLTGYRVRRTKVRYGASLRLQAGSVAHT